MLKYKGNAGGNMARAKYKIITCPSDDAQRLENLLNEMSKAGWDLYTMHEVDTDNGYCYNCIFVTDAQEEKDLSNDDIEIFKSRMEKILAQDNSPYQKCVDIQKKIKEKRQKIEDIKAKLDEVSSLEHDRLNVQMSELINELNELKKQLRDVISPDYVNSSIGEEKLSISLSEEILELVNPDENAVLISEMVKSRQRMVENTGYIIPKVKFVDDDSLQANEFSILVRGVKAFSSYVYPGYLMFYHDELTLDRLPKNSIKDNDAISGREIVWIDEEQTKDFWTKGLKPEEYIAKVLEFVCVKNIDDLFDYNDLNRYVDIVVENNPYLVENCIPDFISLAELKYLLVNLIKEQVSIKDIVYIFEKINDFSDETVKDDLLDKIRVSLAKQISSSISDDTNLISVIRLTSETIDNIINLMDNNEQTIVRVDGNKLKDIIDALMRLAVDLGMSREKIVLLAPLEVRHMIAMVMLQLIPNLRVIAEEEISTDFALDILAKI